MSFLRLVAKRAHLGGVAATPALLRTRSSATAPIALAHFSFSAVQASASRNGLLANRGIRRINIAAPALFCSLRCAPRRFFSASAADSAVRSSPAPLPDVEIKIMGHYLGADAFSSLVIPAHISNRTWRFTQPNSLLIPLDALLAGSAGVSATATPSSAPSTTLTNLFSLPPIPVAPIMRIPSADSTPTSVAAALPASSSLQFDPTQPFVVAFQYGAVVFFNTSEAMQQELLPKLAAKDTAKLKDDYMIRLSNRGDSFSCRFLTDSVVMSGMDLNSVRIISQIISQAVAMQHYEGEANRLLLKLRAMLRPSDRLKGVSTLGHQRSNLIVNYVAESSTAMVDVLTELKLLDRSEIVWGQGEYEPLWQGLRREFDLSDRFDILQTKLDLLKDSHPFFLQVIHQLQSHRMEIIIMSVAEMTLDFLPFLSVLTTPFLFAVLFLCLSVH
jgi:uncharacterized Rmd1/YagE family protein